MAKDAKRTQNEKNIKEKNIKVNEVVTEEVVTEKNKKEKKVKDKSNRNVVSVMRKVDNNRLAIILFVVGFLLSTLLFRCILWPERIATLSDGTQAVANIGETVFTADDLYDNMKQYYSVNVLINDIDNVILTKKYPSNDAMEKEIKNTANYYYSIYESNAGLTKEEFLSQYGFANENAFLDDLRLDHRRNKYFDEYTLKLVKDKDVEKYYKDEVFGDVDSKHILVAIDKEKGLSDAEAKKLAKEIISKLDKGTSWDKVISEYGDKIINEELGYNAFNASLEAAYLKECKNLKVGTYSKTPVLTSYGYHIVYKIDQKEKPKLDDVRDDIKDILADKKKDNDSNLYYKALIAMREEAGLKFVDSKFEKEYKKYVNSYTKNSQKK